MSEESGFIARWSRRKGEARVGIPESNPDHSRVEAANALAPAVAWPASVAESEAPEITPEEIAALPPIDELTAESDLGPFLRLGVPDLLRKAALRRMWSADPAIRDFVGEARDYSWDWNVVGGVPGHGPILPTDDLAATVSRMFEGPDEDGPDIPGTGAVPAQDGSPSSFSEGSEEVHQPPEAVVAPASAQPPIECERPETERNRRHGGAVPL